MSDDELTAIITATRTETGLLINFGSSVQVKRKFRRYQQTERSPKINPVNLVNPV
jgi:hypothetical protein